MSDKPRTWLDSEIITLMENEAREYRHDCQFRQRQFSYREMMENMLVVMKEKGLIEDTP